MAFLDLTSCRDVGYSTGPIDWLTIQRYAEVYDISGEQREDLFYHVQKMDAAYLDWSRSKSKRQTNEATKQSGKPKRRGK